MRAHFGLPSVEAEDKEGKPPISVKFEIPYFTTSGIQVRSPSNGGFANNFSTLNKRRGVKHKEADSSLLCDILSASRLKQPVYLALWF